jgi:hypothetical protein
VAKRQGILDEKLYNAPRNGTPFVDDSVESAGTAAPSDGTSTDTASRELAGAKA